VQIRNVPGNGGLWKTPTGYIDIFSREKSFAHVIDEGIVSITMMIHARPGKSNIWKSLYEVLQRKLHGAL